MGSPFPALLFCWEYDVHWEQNGSGTRPRVQPTSGLLGWKETPHTYVPNSVCNRNPIFGQRGPRQCYAETTAFFSIHDYNLLRSLDVQKIKCSERALYVVKAFSLHVPNNWWNIRNCILSSKFPASWDFYVNWYIVEVHLLLGGWLLVEFTAIHHKWLQT